MLEGLVNEVSLQRRFELEDKLEWFFHEIKDRIKLPVGEFLRNRQEMVRQANNIEYPDLEVDFHFECDHMEIVFLLLMAGKEELTEILHGIRFGLPVNRRLDSVELKKNI